MEMNLQSINPNMAAVEAAAKEASSIVVTDLKDKAQLAAAATKRKELKAMRCEISAKGKEARDEANKFAKSVIAYEKELIAVIEPEENRLAQYEEDAKLLAIREERERKLPERLERLAVADPEGWGNPDVETCRNYINSLDDVAFEAFFNQQVAVKNQQEADRIAAEKAKIDAAKAEEERVKREADDKVRREAEVKAAEERGRKEAEERARAEEVARIEREKAEAEARAKAEAEEVKKLERRKKYIDFLTANGVPENARPPIIDWNVMSEYHVVRMPDGTIGLYKHVADFK